MKRLEVVLFILIILALVGVLLVGKKNRATEHGEKLTTQNTKCVDSGSIPYTTDEGIVCDGKPSFLFGERR